MYIIGIDGGGSHTRLEICEPDGHTVEHREYGSFNISALGEERFRKRLSEVFDPLGSLSECASMCIGSAGVSSEKVGDLIREKLGSLGFKGRLQLCPDYVIALHGAMSGPGAVLVCGTGSVAYGICQDGSEVRVGGYGHLIADEGSGYAIGRDALFKAVRMLDGRVNRTGLLDAVLGAVGGSRLQDILNYIYYTGRDKSAIAAISLAVLECASEGDPAAFEILDIESGELALITYAMASRINVKPMRLALLGGLMEHESIYRRLVLDKLSVFAKIVTPEHDALYGAVALASKSFSEHYGQKSK